MRYKCVTHTTDRLTTNQADFCYIKPFVAKNHRTTTIFCNKHNYNNNICAHITTTHKHKNILPKIFPHNKTTSIPNIFIRKRQNFQKLIFYT